MILRAISFTVVLLLFTHTTVLAGEIAGVTVVPHRIDSELKYRRPHDMNLAARVELYVKGPAKVSTVENLTPAQLLENKEWAWHNLNNFPAIPEGALGVWGWNGISSRWGTGQNVSLQAEGLGADPISIDKPDYWISAVTFLRKEESPALLQTNSPLNPIPNQLVAFIENDSEQLLQIKSCRLYLPKENSDYQILWPQSEHRLELSIPAKEKGFVELDTHDLPLTYCAIEIQTSRETLWAHVRIKREQFDISGGWVFDSAGKWKEVSLVDPKTGEVLRNEFLDQLSSIHINTAHYEVIDGYSNMPKLVDRNRLKKFHRLWPTDQWETTSELPNIHAVEFLGEPQYGGGRPVPPQEVFDKLAPYRATKLPTSVTHSEERIWRYYAGLSDYPHFDAYRVVAPAADSWQQYDRWGEERIRWGAPLETIGNLCRSQRELNRPMPCAVWSQGAHDGWGGGFRLGKYRARRSPNPDELRAQAMHALATRVTSLYWFNLNKPSLDKFPDTIDPLRRIGREIRMLEPFYLGGDAYRFERLSKSDGKPDWELSSIVSSQGALLFAIDTDYRIDQDKLEFVFGEPREVTFEFELPSWLAKPVDLYRVDSEGCAPVDWTFDGKRVCIRDVASRDRVYMAAKHNLLRAEIEERRRRAIEVEQSYLLQGP